MTNNERPYIEHNGTTYEFEASFKLQREYNKEMQNNVFKALKNSGIDEEKFENIKDFQKKFEENKEKNIDDLFKDEELLNKMSEITELISKLDFTSTYEKYCFKMLNAKYNITKEEFDTMLEGFGNEYGIEYVDIMLQKVCEKVFTRMGEKKQTSKKPLPKFMIN